MVNLIPDDSIRSVVDLSMGECGLLEEAKKRWENAVLYGADIDETLIKKFIRNVLIFIPIQETVCLVL